MSEFAMKTRYKDINPPSWVYSRLQSQLDNNLSKLNFNYKCNYLQLFETKMK